MPFIKKQVLFAGVLLFASAVANDEAAAEAPPTIDMLSKKSAKKLSKDMDANRDGKVSMEEILDFGKKHHVKRAAEDIESMWPEMDTNKDGRLSIHELMGDLAHYTGEHGTQEEHDEMMRLEEQKFNVLDTNKNGFLDQDEMSGYFYPDGHDGMVEILAAESIKNQDKDNDGKVSITEYFIGLADHEEEAQNHEVPEAQLKEFAGYDTNGDGKLDFTEMIRYESSHHRLEQGMKTLFRLADADGDDHVTHKELHKAREAIHESEAHQHISEWEMLHEEL